MTLIKRIAVGFAVCFFVCAGLSAQKQEQSVESEYLSSMEDVIITELANSDQRDNKFVALQYLEDAINEGRATPDMAAALDQLAGEGITTQSKTNGRLMNNYPDVRKKACDLLAKVPTKESKTTLVKIALADNEPMVITAAIRSLGEIGMNDNDEVVNVIAFANRHNQTMNPASSMALEVLNAYEKLAPSVSDRSVMLESIGRIATDYRYVTPVRKRAIELLTKMKGGAGNKKQ
ncbi:HEAT repeat domain-containing protein [Treponema parvum]|uniref:HEAT repeat domain-containing protein n=1 Tax=Treponema parvum TaxID=138851 RepID=UPI001AEBEACB|nr:HEAT repeat domain-containing protein [Treponema parvum]QTQ16174.1 HEAT repeat domain-containing protein [Treponema parvum]